MRVHGSRSEQGPGWWRGAATTACALAFLATLLGCGSASRPPEISARFGAYTTVADGGAGRPAAAANPAVAQEVAEHEATGRIQEELAPLAIAATGARYVPGLLSVRDAAGTVLFTTTGPHDPIDSWVIGFRVAVPGEVGANVEPQDVLAVVAADTGKVLAVRVHE